MPRSEVARRLGVSRHAVRQWEKQVEEGGEEAVLWNGRSGRLPSLDGIASRRTHTHVNRRSNETRFRYA
ncbi:helix-turn-helix domain-containing protein, partial [Leptospira santarosai]|uniref:helix-turn-helix domain-containing protein n=1 Tax=Leptospira santarosai TaxID=28183 RepID=UPI001F1844AD